MKSGRSANITRQMTPTTVSRNSVSHSRLPAGRRCSRGEITMKFLKTAFVLSAAVLVPMLSAGAHPEETIKIAFIEGLSGPFANVGEIGLRHYQLAAEAVNARGGVLGGVKFEIVPFDHKTSPQEAQLVFKQAAD